MTRAQMIPRAAGRIAAALGAALAVLLLLAAPALAQGATGLADRFRSNGDLIAGWSWLRDRGLNHYAEYTWSRPPAHGDITIEFEVLATDGVNGGPGVDARFGLLVGFPGAGNMGGVFHRFGVTLENVSPPGDPVGYTNRGFLTLPRARLDAVMGADGVLFIRVLREGAGLPHVAFRADSLRIVGPGPVLERGGSDGSAQSRGGIVIDGTVTLPEDAVEMHPDLGDWGDEGICWLDRPCLGWTADGFRSTGPAGAEGWFWLRAGGGEGLAEYHFATPPATGDMVLDIAVLAQNRPGMRPKDTVHVHLTLGYPGSGTLGGQVGPVTVELPNLWLDPESDIWRARALVVLPEALAEQVVPVTGGLILRFERIDDFEPDVAFSAGSVLLYPAQNLVR